MALDNLVNYASGLKWHSVNALHLCIVQFMQIVGSVSYPSKEHFNHLSIRITNLINNQTNLVPLKTWYNKLPNSPKRSVNLIKE